MWLKSATICGITTKQLDLAQLCSQQFTPVGSHELTSHGWSPLRDDLLGLKLGEQILLRFTQEKKVLPKSAVNQRLDARCREVEEAQGFAPGKKARAEIKEQVTNEMLPAAFATRTVTTVWIDLAKKRLVIDSTANATIELIQKTLLKTFDKFGLEDVSWPRHSSLTEWLKVEPPSDFTIDDEVMLQFPGEKGKKAKFTSANLDADDVQRCLKSGAVVDQLAMTFDRKLSFVMTDNLQLRRIRPLDILKESEPGLKDADRLDNEFYLMSAEMSLLIDALIAEA